MGDVAALIFKLLVVFLAAKAAGFVFSKLRLPVVVGELLVGVAAGYFGLINLHDPKFTITYELIAEIAVILLLFSIGLETKITEMIEVGWDSFWVALLGVIFPFVMGYAYMRISGHGNLQSLFMGAVLVATSVGITARILKELNFISADVSRILLGAAVIDDILGLMVLSILSGVSAKGAASLVSIGATLLIIIAYVSIFTFGGVNLSKKYGHVIKKFNIDNAPVILAAFICFSYALVAGQVGLAPIVGAFMAGMVVAELESVGEIKRKIDDINNLVVVFFFVIMGAKVDLKVFGDMSIIGAGLIVTLIAFVGKMIGCAIPVLKKGMLKASFVGVGMTPRGEVGIIIAAYALNAGIIDSSLYGIAIFVVMLTTILPPFALVPIISKIKAK